MSEADLMEFEEEAPKAKTKKTPKVEGGADEEGKKKRSKPKAKKPPVVEEEEGEGEAGSEIEQPKTTTKKGGRGGAKGNRPKLPEEEEEVPEGDPRPTRREQNIASAFNTLHNKSDGKDLKPGDKGYFSVDDLKAEYEEKGDAKGYLADPRYTKAVAYFKKVNDEWQKEVQAWRENNPKLAAHMDRLRTARRQRTANIRRADAQHQQEQFKKMQNTVAAIQGGLLPTGAILPPGAITAASLDTLNKAPVSSIQAVAKAVFETRASMAASMDAQFVGLLDRLAPNYSEDGATGGAPPAKKARRTLPAVTVVEESEEEEE